MDVKEDAISVIIDLLKQYEDPEIQKLLDTPVELKTPYCRIIALGSVFCPEQLVGHCNNLLLQKLRTMNDNPCLNNMLEIVEFFTGEGIITVLCTGAGAQFDIISSVKPYLRSWFREYQYFQFKHLRTDRSPLMGFLRWVAKNTYLPDRKLLPGSGRFECQMLEEWKDLIPHTDTATKSALLVRYLQSEAQDQALFCLMQKVFPDKLTAFEFFVCTEKRWDTLCNANGCRNICLNGQLTELVQGQMKYNTRYYGIVHRWCLRLTDDLEDQKRIREALQPFFDSKYFIDLEFFGRALTVSNNQEPDLTELEIDEAESL